MRAIGWVGLALIAIGLLLRENYYSRSVVVWMNDAYEQGARTLGSGAPMNYFHQDWPVPQAVSTLGWLALVCFVLGFAVVGYALLKRQK